MPDSALGELSFQTDVFEFHCGFAVGSVPSAPLAQLVEQRTFNPQVLGSSPRGRTFCSRCKFVNSPVGFGRRPVGVVPTLRYLRPVF